ncbi:hypothetical protein ALC62_08580 [Cyphomyrmex costatus]|uniref:Uncharacterized protein n=1 Tax=Cyphomyrmex costatus TaxID=456900 RepID=A0A151IGP8_9HYME|nr:hypothetical protein ALC62_08580 [Cyphomyrmex costatus]
MCVYSAPHTLDHYTFGVFEELSRLDMSRVYNRTGHNAIGESGVDLAPYERSIVLTHAMAYVHESTFQHCSRTLESRDPRHRGLSVPDGETRTLGATLEALDALVAPLQPRETLARSIDATALF